MDYNTFWKKQSDNLHWIKTPQKVHTGQFENGSSRWFEDGQINACMNCLDIHQGLEKEKVAYYFESENGEKTEITYGNLLKKVSDFCFFLSSFGLKKSDVAMIVLPTNLECIVSILACARMGVIHSVVFAGMSTQAIAMRIQDCNPKVLITMDSFQRGGKDILLKNSIPENIHIPIINWSHIKIISQTTLFPVTPMNSLDPLFILYTSGSTGKPKGLVHGHGGYLTQVKYTFQSVMRYEPQDIFFSTADVGWITGHSYSVYGPLMNAATSVIYNGSPFEPNLSRLWDIIENYGVTQFYTAPTLLRMILAKKAFPTSNHKFNSLKLIGSVGEPITQDLAVWFKEYIGKNKAHFIDTWWQTETGAIMLTPSPIGGISLELIRENELVITKPWPSLAMTIWRDHDKYIKTYFTQHFPYFTTNDMAKCDDNGTFHLLGRLDDVINISGHRLGTKEVEDAIAAHSQISAVACVAVQDSIKGESYACFAVRKNSDLIGAQEINNCIKDAIGKWAMTDLKSIYFVDQLPQTRSGKTMRRVLQKILLGEKELGDLSTLSNPECIEQLKREITI